MDKSYLCPSAPLYEGSKLLGIVNEEGNVEILSPPLEINQHFVDAANKNEKQLPEERFRFVNKCLKHGCEQWKNGACGVISRNIEVREIEVAEFVLPECSIRSDCRWYSQEGERACKVCPLIRYI
jgi:hypothetical protein